MKKNENNVELEFDNVGLFTAFITMPFGKEKKVIKGLKSLFAKEKRYIKLKNNSPLYNPIFYYMWGSFDLAAISLVDDFSLSNRKFHPHSHLFYNEQDQNDQKTENFNFQVDTSINIYKKNKKIPENLESKFNNLSEFNYYANVSLKINNALLIGAGVHLIELVKLLIDEIIKKSSYKLNYLITNSFSCDEVIINFFSNDIDNISDLILKVRSSNLKELISEVKNTSFLIIDDKKIKINDILKNINNCDGNNIKNCHLFTMTYSNYGFNINSLSNSRVPNSNLRLITTLQSKPGHSSAIENSLKQITKNKISGKITTNNAFKLKLIIGENDFIIEKNNQNKLTILEYYKIISFISKHPKLSSNIRKIKTLPLFDNDSSNETNSNIESKGIRPKMFTINELKEVRDNLYELHISKVVRNRIIKVFTNFNDGISDPVLYRYFIDIQMFMKFIKIHLDELKKSSAEIRHLFLIEIADIFEYLYANRFHQSHRMLDVTDFNIDFNGGLQQLISGFNIFYRSLFKQINGYTNDKAVVYVVSQPNVKASHYALKISYFHIFEPILFLTEVVKEASNASLDLPNELNLSKLQNQLKFKIINEYKFHEFTEYAKYFVSPQLTLLNYFYEDAMTFQFSHKKDLNIFKLWHWGIPLQDAASYEDNNKIRENIFIRICIRYNMILHLFGIEDNNPIAPNSILQDLWNKHYFKIKSFTKQNSINIENSNTSNNTEWSEYFFLIKKQIDKIINDEILSRSIYGITQNETIDLSMISQNNIFMSNFTNYINYKINLFVKEFKLDLTKTVNRASKNKITTPLKVNTLLFDNLGGFVATGDEFRKKYFKERVLCLYEMIHFSLLNKNK